MQHEGIWEGGRSGGREGGRERGRQKNGEVEREALARGRREGKEDRGVGTATSAFLVNPPCPLRIRLQVFPPAFDSGR